jgi:hypothetical protein
LSSSSITAAIMRIRNRINAPITIPIRNVIKHSPPKGETAREDLAVFFVLLHAVS